VTSNWPDPCRQDSCRPLNGVASMFKRNSGASAGSVVNGQMVTESVSKRSSWMITAGRGFPTSASARLRKPGGQPLGNDRPDAYVAARTPTSSRWSSMSAGSA